MSENLMQLKNIGNTSAHWLKTIGINTPEQLRNVGAVEAYLRIQNRGIKTSKVLLYALHGALEDIYWNEISDNIKKELNTTVLEKEASVNDS